MPEHVFLTVPVGRRVGLTSISIGFVRLLDRLGIPVGFFKALGQPHPNEDFDRSSAYLEATTTLRPPTPIDHRKVAAAVTPEAIDGLMEDVISQFDELPDNAETVIVEGLNPTADLPHAHRLNAALRRALNAEVVIVTRPEDSHPDALARHLERLPERVSPGLLEERPAVIFNHVDLPALGADLGLDAAGSDAALQTLKARLPALASRFDLIGLVPAKPELGHTRTGDAIQQLHGTILRPGEIDRRRIRKITLCARTVGNTLGGLTAGTLVVTPSDRSDIVLACAVAASKSIRLAGLILTGETEPQPTALDFCAEAFERDGGLPLMRMPGTSFEIAKALHELNPEIPVADEERIHLVMDTVARAIHSDWIRARCAAHIDKHLSPPAFRHRISKIARAAGKHIVLPEGEEPRTLDAAIRCAERGIARCHLIGDPDKIREVARLNDLVLHPDLQLVDPAAVGDRYLEPLLARRRHKGLTEARAREALRDLIVLGTMMVALDEVDGLVSGAVHNTAATIRPALQLIRTAPGARVVSSVFFMCLPDQVLVYGDCAVNPDPDAEMLADIAIQSAASARAFGIDPVVAMISYSTHESGSGSDVEKVREATAIARRRAPDLLLDGPLQYDAASNREVARSKAPDSPVAGRANVFIFPDLNTGNTTYKAVQRSAGVVSIGPMLQGLAKPVNDLSRGASVEDILYTIAITAVQARAADA